MDAAAKPLAPFADAGARSHYVNSDKEYLPAGASECVAQGNQELSTMRITALALALGLMLSMSSR